MTIFKNCPAPAAEDELARLERRHAEMCAQLDTERARAAQVEADLLTRKAEICDVTSARQRCAAVEDAVNSLQGQIDIKAGECAAQWRADEVGRTLAEIGERRRVLEARRVRCRELHDEGVEALRNVAGRMAEESAVDAQERSELAGLVARLRELRAELGTHAGHAGEAETLLPTARAFSPRAGLVVDPLSASVCRAFDAAMRQGASVRHAAAMGAATKVEIPQGCTPGGVGDPWAKGIGGD